MIHQDDADLPTVAGIDNSRTVDQAQPVPKGKPTAGMDERGVASREGNRDPGRYKQSLPRADDRIHSGAQIQSRITGVLDRRKVDARIESLDEYLDLSHGLSSIASPSASQDGAPLARSWIAS